MDPGAKATLLTFADCRAMGKLPPNLAATTVQACGPELKIHGGSALVSPPRTHTQNPLVVLLTNCGYIIKPPSATALATDSILLPQETLRSRLCTMPVAG